MIEHGFAGVNGQRLHYAAAGDGALMLFLHGFPEYWYAWRHQLAFFGRVARAVAPDLRGYNRSSKPARSADYALPLLVEDIAGLVAHFGVQRATIVGHDWGGVVAWAMAQARPELVERLVIINAPHPAIFRRELAENPAQRAASAYIARLRHPEAEATLSANAYAALAAILLDPLERQGYFDDADRQAYLAAWAQPGALTGALNYYRAAEFVPQPSGEAPPATALERPIVAPTLVIWGEADSALLTGNLNGLERYVPSLAIERVPHASHWIVHECPDIVNHAIARFCGLSDLAPSGGAL